MLIAGTSVLARCALSAFPLGGLNAVGGRPRDEWAEGYRRETIDSGRLAVAVALCARVPLTLGGTATELGGSGWVGWMVFVVSAAGGTWPVWWLWRRDPRLRPEVLPSEGRKEKIRPHGRCS